MTRARPNPRRDLRRDLRRDPLRVAVIGGGANCEHEVSLASAASAAGALDGFPDGRYEVVPLTIATDGRWLDALGVEIGLTGAVDEIQCCDVVLPLVHGPHGEDGTLAALCELAGVPYVGSPVGAGAIGMDKWTTKLVAASLGVATAPGDLLTPETAAGCRWEGPCVVKPVTAGSSRGVSLVAHPSELGPALTSAFELDTRVLVEQVVVGREIDVAVLRRIDGTTMVSPALEIAVEGFFDYDAKYGGGAPFVVPAPLAQRDRSGLEAAATALVTSLGCRGVVRVDFFLTSHGWILNEVNTTPGLTASSQVPRMFAAAGMTYPALLDLLVQDVMGSTVTRPNPAPGRTSPWSSPPPPSPPPPMGPVHGRRRALTRSTVTP